MFKKILLITLLFIAVLIWAIAITSSTQKVEEVPRSEPITEKTLMSLIQDWRYDNYLSPYTKLDSVCRYANLRLTEIKKNFSHDGFYDKTNYPCENCRLGENLAHGYGSPTDVLNAWLKSASHAANLKDDFKYSCIRTDGEYTVHIFVSYY